MKFLFFSAVTLVSWLNISMTLASAKTPIEKNQPSQENQASIEEFVRIRCSTDGKDVYTEWQGSVYAYPLREKPRKLFNILGVNIARCLKNKQGQWVFTSRELNYYLDPNTSKIIHQWENPWTKEIVPVVHVANNPVQGSISGNALSVQTGNNITYIIDVPLFYPNILANDPKYKDYSAETMYQAGEFFKITAVLNEVKDSSKTVAENVITDWTRIGPWLPWMKMKGQQGYLFYSAVGQKKLRFTELSPVLQAEINSRLPLYRTAPSCFLNAKNETSWSYFQKYFDNYLQGEMFPISTSTNPENCQE